MELARLAGLEPAAFGSVERNSVYTAVYVSNLLRTSRACGSLVM
jgi:hypothetical protein